jgi:hypothetical protein
MDSDPVVYAGGYVLGDEAMVVEGTFVGMAGRVLSPNDAICL